MVVSLNIIESSAPLLQVIVFRSGFSVIISKQRLVVSAVSANSPYTIVEGQRNQDEVQHRRRLSLRLRRRLPGRRSEWSVFLTYTTELSFRSL